jgi:DNA modification methylase
MKDWPDNCVDLVLTDPPYIGLKGGAIRQGKGVAAQKQISYAVGDEWDANLDWTKEAWRVTKYGAVSFCSYHFVAELALCFPKESHVCLLTWNKLTSPVPLNNVPRFSTEFIWAFKKTPGLMWRKWMTTDFIIPNITAGCVSTGERFVKQNGTALHPAQKPLRLMKELLSIGGDIVLDPFCGTGTTCVAAKTLGRNYVGIDISEEYCQIARDRIKAVESGVPVKEARKGQKGLFECG